MQEEQKILLEHLADALFRVPSCAPVTDGVIAEAIQQTVLTLLPVEGHKLYLPMMANHAQVEWEHQHVHALMKENNIPYVIMKGVVSAAYYPDPSRRPLGDVDFLVREEDFLRAQQVLEADGFVRNGDDSEYHLGYQAGRRNVELHRLAPGMPQEHTISRYFADMVDRAEWKNGCMCTSVFHHGLLLLTHSSKHLLDTGIGLRHLCDWAVFYASFSEQGFVSMFEMALKDVGLWKYAQILSQLCVRYLGAPDQSWIGKGDPALAEALMEDIFAGGNFGRKNQERYNQARIITDEDQHAVSSIGPIRNLMRALLRKTYHLCPVCKKWKILLPAGVVYTSVRYGIWMIQGKRPMIHIKDAVQGAQKRKALYRQLELYQPE